MPYYKCFATHTHTTHPVVLLLSCLSILYAFFYLSQNRWCRNSSWRENRGSTKRPRGTKSSLLFKVR